jgi:ferric-dicitrate binding protein FerR (iron transport regulator)
MLSFDKVRLGEAVQAMNEINGRKIVLDDAKASGRRIVGGFNAKDPDGFAQMVAAMFELAVTRRPNGDLVLSAKH